MAPVFGTPEGQAVYVMKIVKKQEPDEEAPATEVPDVIPEVASADLDADPSDPKPDCGEMGSFRTGQRRPQSGAYSFRPAPGKLEVSMAMDLVARELRLASLSSDAFYQTLIAHS